MKKRGQFFLIAALIIISIIIGFSIVYNYASVNKPDAKAARLAEMIKYEATQVINQDFDKNKEDMISSNINNLVKAYAESNIDMEIHTIEEETKDNFKHILFQGNNEPKEQLKPTSSAGKIIAAIHPSLSYTFDNTPALHDVYIIIKKEGNNERFIAVK